MWSQPVMKILGVLCLVLFLSWSSSTKSNDDDLSSDNVITIVGKLPVAVEGLVGAASVISSQQIDRRLVQDIADLVRYENGISIEKSGTRFGHSGPSIRGVGGNRVATEVDGIPVAQQFDIGSYSSSTRNLVDPELIYQVEVLRGPASSIYGSDAIGGVVSYVTKRPIDLLSKSDGDFYIGLKTGFRGVDNSKMININQAIGGQVLSALLSVTRRRGEEFDNQLEAGFSEDQQRNDSLSLHGKLVWTPDDDDEISLHIDDYQRESTTDIKSFLGRGRFSSTSSLFGDDTISNRRSAINYEFVADSQIVEGGVIRLFTQKSETEQLTDEARFTRGTHFKFDRDFFYSQETKGVRFNLYTESVSNRIFQRIGYGLEWEQSQIEELRNGLQANLDNGTSTNTILSEVFPLRDFPNSDVSKIGVYINDEITFSSVDLRIIPAIRYDYYKLKPKTDAIYREDNPATAVVSISEKNISPKLGVAYSVGDQLELYAQYIRGFRSPPFEDANIGLDIALFNIRAIPNPDLVSEKSNGYEIGFDYDSRDQSIELALYYNDYRDFIQTKVNLGLDPVTGRVLFQSQNIERAKIYGAEINYKMRLRRQSAGDGRLEASANAFWNKSENKETAQPLNSLDPNQLQLGFHWFSVSQSWNVDIYSTLVDAKDNIDESNIELFKPKGYAMFDLIANYQSTESLLISAGIFNLSDKKYWRWSDVRGLGEDDLVIESLSAAGINASLQFKMAW